MLVEAGVISADQLRAALRAQLVRGGHLGTCLIELNYLDEESLGQVLAKIHQVEHASISHFSNIPQSVIDCVSRQIVERRRVVPISFEDNALNVAMANPSDLLALDELAFATGMNIRPWVSPEVRIVAAMERYYGIPRSPRFLRMNQSRQEHVPDSPTRSTGWDAVSVIPLAHARSATPTSQPPRVSAAAAIAPAGSPQMTPLPAGGEDTEWGRILRELFQQIPTTGHGTVRSERETEVSQAALLREFERVSDVLSTAARPSLIARAVLECAAHGLSRCMLLVVRNFQARIWDWRGAGLDPATVSRVRFPVDAQGVFELVAGSDWYRGEIPQQPSQLQFYRELGLAVPTEALIVPVYFEERLAAILYGDGGDLGRICGETEIYHRLTQKMGIALTLLALKRKLQQA
jgi:hypothetical protein